MKSYNYVMQENNFDCGLASLLTCFYNLGFQVPKAEVLKYLKVTDQGIKAYDLINTSKKLGITSCGLKGELTSLTNKHLPCIAHIIKENSYYHYIVILEINHNKKILKVFDPSQGKLELSFDQYNEISTKVYIVFNKNSIPQIKDKRFKNYLFNLYLENKKTIHKCSLLSLFFILFSIISSYYVNVLLEILNSKNILSLILVFLFFLSISLCKNMIDFLKNKLIISLKLKIDKKINQKVIRHIISLPYEYYSTKSSGEFITIINDVENFKDLAVNIFIILSVDLILISLIIIYITIYNIVYLPVFLLFILFIFFTIYKYKSIYHDNFIKLYQSKMSFSSYLVETLEAFYSIKGLHIEKIMADNVSKIYSKVIKNNKEYLSKNNIYNFTINNIGEIFYLISIFICALLIIYQHFYFLNIVFFSSIFYLLIGFISNIADSLVMNRVYKSSIIKVLDILEINKEEFRNVKVNQIQKVNFQNISLIIEDKPILKDINFEIKKGDRIFIKGRSGSGKSTLIKLLLKYYEPTQGKILFDNINYKYFDLDYIRKNITYVSQNEFLFTDTIYNNLSIIDDNKRKIKKALNTCLIYDSSNTKINEDFLLVDNGINISGGERKKLLISRGLLCANNILIFDETFNEIDIKTERKILKNIFNNYPDLTIVLISHRYNNHDLFNKKFDLENKKEEVYG